MSDTETLPAEQAKPKPVLKAGGSVTAIVPQDIEQAYRLANIITSAGMAPKSYGTDANKVMVGIMHGMEVGFTPMAALQSIAVINGMPSIYGDGAIGLVRASGRLEDFSETLEGEGENMEAVCSIKRRDEATPIVRRFSMADAKKANLTGKAGPWTQYPKRMLQMRARSWALRDGFADVLKGLHIAEEVRDMGDLIEGEDGSYTAAPVIPDAPAPANDPWEFTDIFGEVDHLGTEHEFAAAFIEMCKALIDNEQAKEYHAANTDSLSRLSNELRGRATECINNTRSELELSASETEQAVDTENPEIEDLGYDDTTEETDVPMTSTMDAG